MCLPRHHSRVLRTETRGVSILALSTYIILNGQMVPLARLCKSNVIDFAILFFKLLHDFLAKINEPICCEKQGKSV